jgi:hypothetical protein
VALGDERHHVLLGAVELLGDVDNRSKRILGADLKAG